MLRQSDETTILDIYFRLPLGENGQKFQASHGSETLEGPGFKPDTIESEAYEELDPQPSTNSHRRLLHDTCQHRPLEHHVLVVFTHP